MVENGQKMVKKGIKMTKCEKFGHYLIYHVLREMGPKGANRDQMGPNQSVEIIEFFCNSDFM